MKTIKTAKKQKLKESKGITLIALVITIIVLLILAGVTISTLTGDNGILKQADKAKTETTMGEEKEAIGLAYNGAKTEKLGGEITAEGLNTQFTKNGTKATASGGGTIKVDFETGRSYTLKAINGEIKEGIDIADFFSVGDYVNYPDKNGNNILCKVLYNNENYGVQLVSVNPVDTVILGDSDPTIPSSMASESYFEKVKYSYNNAIKTLNDKAEEYRNSKYTAEGKARCVGSVPDNPYSEARGYFTSSWSFMSIYNGKLRKTDNNYNEDWSQLETIGARGISDVSKSSFYWLASRRVSSWSTHCDFNVRSVNSDGSLQEDRTLGFAYNYGQGTGFNSYWLDRWFPPRIPSRG